jgi:predicted TIM-barrel fold metal-dependent hydrolase
MMYAEEFHHNLKLSERPSDFWYRQCHVSFQDETSAEPIFHLTGYDNIMWASDFPHPDGLWPDSHKFIDAQLGHLPADVRHKIIYGNAARLYGLPDTVDSA